MKKITSILCLFVIGSVCAERVAIYDSSTRDRSKKHFRALGDEDEAHSLQLKPGEGKHFSMSDGIKLITDHKNSVVLTPGSNDKWYRYKDGRFEEMLRKEYDKLV